MALGLIGRKCGMTRVFTEDGVSVPVSVVQIDSNRVSQVKGLDTDGYRAVQVAAGEKKSSKVNKALAGHYAAANMTAGRGLWEFRLGEDEGADLEIGSELTVGLFSDGQIIDVKGTSIGKGFQGGVKRHNFQMQDATHGNSISHRSNGSIGMCQTPGRVFKGKKMSGHMGAESVTTQNLTIHSIDAERNLILVKGAIPGAKGGDVILTPAIKQKNKG
ncbi:large subunit ribosomal protein L3 [Bathymodiolus platifrons methanotrophic gill symbiont]|uniref:50S ribosomal protein L3 n=1 Tax=Bathymodiolus platifrons methanotrophic gill symbiont TaxID=113268 RepID=UPI000B412E2E|nr:50S ribosomal protein L3 [Bathymodiolus platifrons methanotrophic gill symbiont]MCK5869076.1 50S ribosomal protein L3 [Methyloprofundus sp.]TXK97413.1 50S ribosomal protein L3 [Methylococcaceae bacterium CS4]TXK99737.1 50S ribosomal protein L3 [Methylococcaceae bacterium CS5]TXL06583.1 50S ribosomal protein L3 [Methylococcaceae bacterium CS1]TXL09524.1 50S ribosomal protein L3 [Methylococcaceae bacterium CS3]TXL12164.1 50S ribosomal protein L3 [Methylococcaceae bacterium CS2]TXL16302.1 50